MTKGRSLDRLRPSACPDGLSGGLLTPVGVGTDRPSLADAPLIDDV
jgi:hypothetical protein